MLDDAERPLLPCASQLITFEATSHCANTCEKETYWTNSVKVKGKSIKLVLMARNAIRKFFDLTAQFDEASYPVMKN